MASQLLKKLSVYVPLWKRSIPKYPLYYKGDPQLRVFLPLFWMKMVKAQKHTPENTVVFEVHPQMTVYDVKNYLENIYQVPVDHVRTSRVQGKTRKDNVQGYTIQPEDDKKLAFVQLAEGEKFEFPEIFKDKQTDEGMTVQKYKDMTNEYNKTKHKHWDKLDVPSWFR